MKLERARDRSKNAGIPRARMFLKAHLDWLDGAPVGQSEGQVVWKTRPRIGSVCAQTIVVDRQTIQHSQSSLTTLTRRFPNAMQSIVGDLNEWHTNVASVLDLLKSAVHEDVDILDWRMTPVDSLNRSQQRMVVRVVQEHPSLRPLLQMVIWSGHYSGVVRNFMISWIVENAAWLDQFLITHPSDESLTLVMLIADLVRVDGSDVLSIIKPVLADPSLFQLQLGGFREQVVLFLNRLREWKDLHSPPPTLNELTGRPIGELLQEFLIWVSGKDRTARLRAVQLAADVISFPLIRLWQQSWDRFLTTVHSTIRSLCRFAKDHERISFHPEACRLSYVLQEEFKDEPLRYPLDDILSLLRAHAIEGPQPFHDALSRFLSVISIEHDDGSLHVDGIALRLETLFQAIWIHHDRSAIPYFQNCRQFLTRNRSHPKRLVPWIALIKSWKKRSGVQGSPFVLMQTESSIRPRWAEFFRILDRLIDDPDYRGEENAAIICLIKYSASADQVCQRYLDSAPRLLFEDSTPCQIQTAATLETDGFPFSNVLQLVRSSGASGYSELCSLRQLHRAFVDAGWKSLVPSLLTMKRHAEISRLSKLLEIAEVAGEIPTLVRHPDSPVTPEWALNLPELLQPLLAVFQSAFPDSRQRLQRLLEKQYPDRHKLQTEIETLERFEREGPLHVNLKRRLNNLRQRLAHPKIVPEATILRLRDKLFDALLTEVTNDSHRRIQLALKTILGGDTCLHEFSNHLVPDSHLELISGILSLDSPYRAYGLRLLNRCWGKVTWDLENEEPNRRFVSELAHRGIRVEPWLSARVTRITIEGQSDPWTLSFESNDVEKLLMGYHFGTCLSPDDCNFYSAVTNAIDINKRILYARDVQGKVMGRCLFAIGDSGAIVVFRPYCHSTPDEFLNHVAQFATQLASEMGTVISHTDHVSPLVAPGWYNDGACNLGNSMTADGSPLRVALQNATEESLLPALQQAIAPASLNESILELIISLPEMQARSELVRPLLPTIQRMESQLGVSTLMTVARLAEQARAHDVAMRLLVTYSPKWLIREITREGYCEGEALATLELLAKYRPSLALRILRTTRPRDIRDDDEETDGRRRILLAQCFDSLGRTNRAARMRGGKVKVD